MFLNLSWLTSACFLFFFEKFDYVSYKVFLITDNACTRSIRGWGEA